MLKDHKKAAPVDHGKRTQPVAKAMHTEGFCLDSLHGQRDREENRGGTKTTKLELDHIQRVGIPLRS